MGAGDISKLVKKLSDALNDDEGIIVICGTNKKLYKQLIDENIPHVIIKGQVNNMPVYMKACDVIYTSREGLHQQRRLSAIFRLYIQSLFRDVRHKTAGSL